MTFTIPGDPIGKERPRVVKGHAYTPAKTKAYEDKVRWCFKQAHGKLIEGPVAVAITAYHAIPRKASKAVREAMESGARLPLKKPDADNIAKAICDALNGIAYKDDSQIVALLVFKRFGEPRVEVNIMGGDLCSSAV